MAEPTNDTEGTAKAQNDAPETDEAIPVEKLITTLPGAEPVWELIRRYEALREKPKPQPEADEAEMLCDGCDGSGWDYDCGLKRLVPCRCNPLGRERPTMLEYNTLLSRYQSQQERIAELEADLNEWQISVCRQGEVIEKLQAELANPKVAARLAAEGGDQLAETKPSTTTKANQDK